MQLWVAYFYLGVATILNFHKVVVYDSFKAEPIWEFTGIVYMSGSHEGNVSIIYKKGGEYYKNDFVGPHLNVYMIECPKN